MAANSIKHSIRNSDDVGRLGGEEFLVIIRDTNSSSLQEVAEKLRIMIFNSLLVIDERLLQITVSIGATMLRMDDTSETAIKRADELMYISKENGRNRVSTDQDSR